jgi:hypothetical protein
MVGLEPAMPTDVRRDRSRDRSTSRASSGGMGMRCKEQLKSAYF